MPDRYHVHTAVTPGRFYRVGKYATVDWREDCSRCSNCVKPRCQYDAYKKEVVHNRDPLSPIQLMYECKACLSCVQGCTKGLLALSINPEYLEMGDWYWTPDIINTTWNQSDTGRIPVSGAGYRGRFYGPGFDSIWTDMSEIVRPTRDGIHGREYISTSVDIGPKPLRLEFSDDGWMKTPPATLIETQLPAILDLPPWPMHGNLGMARAVAASHLKTLAVVRPAEVKDAPADERPWIVPLLGKGDASRYADLVSGVRMVEIADGADLDAVAAETRLANPAIIVAVRIDVKAGTADRVAALAKKDFKVFHLMADLHGFEKGVETGARHLKDTLREIHGRLIREGVRDEVTLIAGGGIALAEHMAKAIICGADMVAVDVPLLVSLGCRVCCTEHGGNGHAAESDCPAAAEDADVAYLSQRMINLMGAWHSQMIEVLGAMGIREVRRLRGEVGRAIFLEDMEREAFGDLIRK
jgi:hypothetical protein